MKDKSLSINIVWNLLYKMVSFIIPFIFTIYASHIFGAKGIGEISFAQNIVSYFLIVAALGIPNYGVKCIGATRFQNDKRNTSFTELFIISVISSLVCAIALFLIVNLAPITSNNLLIYILGVQVILNFINLDWLFQGLENYRFITIRSTIVKVLSLILLIVFVHDEQDIIKYTAILSFSYIGNNLLNIFFISKNVHFSLCNINIEKHLKPIFVLLASTFATEVYTLLDSTMLGVFCTKTDLGYYTNSTRLIRMVFNLITAISVVNLPRMSLYYKENKMKDLSALVNTSLKFSLIIAIPCSFGIFSIADMLVPILFGDTFLPSIVTLKIVSGLVTIFTIAFVLGHLVLISTNQEKSILKATIVGAISNIILNCILIKTFKNNGVAFASVVAEVLVTVFLVKSAKNIVKIDLSKRFIFSTLISSSIMAITILLLCQKISVSVLSLSILIIVGIIVYGVAMIFMKNEMVLQILNKSR